MKKWRSRVTIDGLDRAPHRAFMRAMGLDDAALAKPMIGVVSMKGEQTPCNMTHDFQVEAAKEGIAEAGGTPREFTTVSVSDGISMNHEGMKFSLFSRELIADSIEAVVHGLAYDALIGFGGCDKTLPGVMMGMIRCNVPSIFIYGGSALPGRFEGKTLTVLDSYEAVGGFMTGEVDEATLIGIERSCLPTIGACAGQFTANTMGMVAEVLGFAPPGSATLPAVDPRRAAVAKHAGTLVMDILCNGGPLPRDLITPKSLENACAIVAATGGSTNAGLHIPAMAHEAGLRFTLDDVAAVFERMPLIGNLQPGGQYYAQDVDAIGGVPALVKTLLAHGYLHGDTLTVTGQTLAQACAGAPDADGAVIRAADQPIAPTGGVIVIKGNLAPDGALIKVAGLKSLLHEGPARVFESEEDAIR
jgi:dihydroxy-acid dehydratase